MKTHLQRIFLLSLPLSGLLLISSCVNLDDDDDGQANHNHATRTGYVTYDTLPSDYEGDAYYHDRRYYAGGRYETGRYSYEGRNYNTRYYHNGRYLYGGDYRQNGSPVSYQKQPPRSSGSVEYVTYRTLPANYTGDAYYYDNRYYAGGRYEPGRYTYGGRDYDHRYYHNGNYLYGGTYRQTTLSNAPSEDRSNALYRAGYRRGSY